MTAFGGVGGSPIASPEFICPVTLILEKSLKKKDELEERYKVAMSTAPPLNNQEVLLLY